MSDENMYHLNIIAENSLSFVNKLRETIASIENDFFFLERVDKKMDNTPHFTKYATIVKKPKKPSKGQNKEIDNE